MASSGHTAASPAEIPAGGWKDILLRVRTRIVDDHIGLTAAGVAFYGLLSLFPAVTAFVAISGLVLTPSVVADNVQTFTDILPDGASGIILDQVTKVAGSDDSGLSIAAIVGLLIALYSASRGVASLIEGLNMANEEKETRGFIRLILTTLILTVFMIVGLTAGLAAVIALPSILAFIQLGAVTEALIGLLRWVALIGLTIVGIGMLYRFGPDRKAAQVKWITPGAILACVLWVAASIGFSIYTENFASYNETFGTLAGVVILLMWLWISAYVILLGAELNAEAEAQTRYDTTIGPGMPPGRRGAVKADEVRSD